MEKNNLKIFFVKLIAVTFSVIVIINVVFNLLLADKIEKIDNLLSLDKSKFRSEMRDKIRNEIRNGLEIDSSICADFEKKTKHKNFIFANGIDFIYEFFNIESKFNNSFLTKSIKLFGKNKHLNKIFTNLADKGLVI